MMDFTNISEILDISIANLGILVKSMISVRFPHAKPFVNRSFPDFVISGRVPPLDISEMMFLGEKFLVNPTQGF